MMKAIAHELERIVGSASVQPWESLPAAQQLQIRLAIAPDSEPKCLVYPNTQAELAEVVACAHQNRWRILPSGQASKLSWGGLAAGVDLVVSTERLTQVIEHAVGDLTLTVEAGALFSQIQSLLANSNQWLALDPAYPNQATIGGIVATADTGSLRQRYGGVRDMLLGLSFVRYDGEVAKAGGRVVKNVAGYDLMKLMTGSYGTLGIISQVTFRAYPQLESSESVVLTGTAEAIAQTIATVLNSALTPTAMDVLSAGLVKKLGLGSGIGAIARFQSVSASVKEQTKRFLDLGQSLGLVGHSYTGADEADLWQSLNQSINPPFTELAITCKIGVKPSAAVSLLTQLDALASESAFGFIHAGSGLGQWCLDERAVPQPHLLPEMRSLCQAQSGFLSILQAPVALKQQLDVWGYTGNAIDLMRRLKQQFDPEMLFSPHRFVGGI